MTDDAKRAAGQAAAGLVEDGMRLGLGTGSTVAHFLDALAARRLDVAGVPTSEGTAERCRELGIGLLDPGDVDELDLVVDGADELDAALTLTKGGGGALVREKVVATLGRRVVVVATVDKLVSRLGDTFAVPIEVVPFAVAPVTRAFEEMGFEVARRIDDGIPYVTDNGNAIVTVRRDGGIEDPATTDVVLCLVPGVVGTGLFVGLAHEALLGDDHGRVTTVRPARDDEDDA